MTGNSKPSILTWDLLRSLGFQDDPSVLSDTGPGLSYNFGEFKVSASWVTNRYFRSVILLTGVIRTSRTLSRLECEMPTVFRIAEQGVAWIVWALESATSNEFTPTHAPEWLDLGREYRYLLPWEQELAAYEARPHCYIDRDWFRVALKKLRELLEHVAENATVTVSFDGTICKISCEEVVFPLPAEGNPWEDAYAIAAGQLRKLPKRLMREKVVIAVWKERLSIANCGYSGVYNVSDKNTTPTQQSLFDVRQPE